MTSRLTRSLSVLLLAITLFAGAAQARPVPQRQPACLRLPRPWYCLDVQRMSRADAMHAVRHAVRIRVR